VIVAVDGRLATSFTAGLLAAVNPCGFVLLPTYLIYFLGMENLRPGAERASVPRALKVSLAVSAGFLGIFVVIGAVTKLTSSWFLREPGPYLSLAVGVLLVALGIAMLFGYRLPFTTPKIDVGERDRSVRSMFVFGLAYAIASLGCSLPIFAGTVLGAFTSDGVVTGVVAISLYGVGMALIVTTLTVSLAMANTAVLAMLRKGMSWFENLAGAFVLLSGLYLCWYWISSIRSDYDSAVLGVGESWQGRIVRFVESNEQTLVVVGMLVVGAAVALSVTRRRSEPTP
jgi:cytochrome c-type biogenesis protein